MKRLFSVILILTLILSGICIPNVSASTSANAAIEEKEVLLTRLGVLDAESVEDMDQYVTRGQFIIAAVRMLGYTEEMLSSTDVQYFVDVPTGDPAAAAVNMAYTQGIIDGTGSKMFMPNENITYEQALKIMVSVLGWTKTARSDDLTRWCVNKAGEIGIMDDITQGLSEPLTAASMITLMYNSLECAALVVSSISGNSIKAETSNLLYTSFRAVKATGIVTANALTGLKGEGTNQDNEIEIDNDRYSCTGIDAGQYLGYEVTFYYIEARSGDIPQLIWIKPRKTTVTEINARDLVDFSNGQYTYFKENGSTGRLKISQSADIIYNGKNPDNITEQMYIPKAGKIRVLSRDGSSSADVIFIEDYYNIFVYSIDQQQKILYDKYDPSKQLDLDSRSVCSVVYDSGDEADFSAIKTDTLVSVMESEDREYVNIIINSSKQTGTISEVGAEKLVMDGTEYRISKLYDSALQPEISPGETGTLFLDMSGEAAAFSSEASGEDQIGYLINAWIIDGGGQVELKLLSAQGTIEQYKLAKSVSIDSSRVKADEEIISKLSYNGAIKQQIIQYTLNDSNEISKIDLAYEGSPEPKEKENSLHLEYDSGTEGYSYKSYAGTFSGKINIDNTTIVFSVPEEGMSEDMYTVESTDYFVNDETYRLKSYMIDPNGIIADAVVLIRADDQAISDTNTLGLVSKMYEGVSADGDVKNMLSVYNDGILKELAVADEDIFQNADIENGDVIRFALNSKGEINILEKTYDHSEDVMINSESHNNRLYNSKFKLIQAGLYNKSGKVLVVAPLDKIGSDIKDDYTKYTLVSMSNIYIYDSNARNGYNASIGSESDLVDYLHAGADFSKLIIRSEYAQPRDIIIYK